MEGEAPGALAALSRCREGRRPSLSVNGAPSSRTASEASEHERTCPTGRAGPIDGGNCEHGCGATRALQGVHVQEAVQDLLPRWSDAVVSVGPEAALP